MARFMSMVERLIDEDDAPLPSPLVDALRALAEDYDRTAPFHAVGDRMVRTNLARTVRQRRAFDRRRISDPPEVAPAVFVIGLPRTGSTMLHNLFGLDRATATIPLAQATFPFAADEAPDVASDPVTATALQLAVVDRLDPTLRHLHPMAPGWPEECTTLLQLTGASERLLGPAPSPAYERLLAADPGEVAYREYAELLGLLRPDANRWVLKAAHHLPFLRTIDDVFAPSLYVWLHRDPFDAVTSFARLVEHVRGSVSDQVDREALGPEILRRYARTIDLAIDAVGDLRAPVLHVAFRDTVDAPVDVVRRCYDAVGWSLPGDFEVRAATWLDVTREAASQPPAPPERYGLARRDATDAFARYLRCAEEWIG